MATQKTRPKTPGKRRTAEKTTAKTVKKTTAKITKSRVTLATLADRIAELSEQIGALASLLTAPSALKSKKRAAATSTSDKAAPPAKTEKRPRASGFLDELVAAVGAVDRRGRHGGLVPIPEVRERFLADGWTRQHFDEELLQAERDFVVDLKTADDPARLPAPELAIRQTGRGHLQFVVLR